MKRRDLFKQVFTAGPKAVDGIAANEKKRVLRIAHITDVSIRPEYNAPERYRKCLEDIKKKQVDLILNGGNTICKANADSVTRERVKEMWEIWKKTTAGILDQETLKVYSCLGNDDLWWPDNKEDDMYAKGYAMKQLEAGNVKPEKRYYSFKRGNWHFVILDSTKKYKDDKRVIWIDGADQEQKKWLENELDSLAPDTPVVCMSHIPILSVTRHIVGGNEHQDAFYFKNLFYKHRNKKIYCISGYRHLLETAELYGVKYFCNGSVSGYWWENGDQSSAAKGYYRETPPGYAILDLYEDGTLVNEYIPHGQ